MEYVDLSNLNKRKGQIHMKFIYEFFLFFLLIFGTIILIWVTVPYDNNRYEAVLIDKHILLLNDTKPKIIFVGDSNLAFGLNSTLVEQTFLNYNVINFGIAGGFGINLLLNDIKPFLRQRDIVIISPVHRMFYTNVSQFIDLKPKYGSESLLSIYLDIYPEGIRNFEIPQLINTPKVIQCRLPFKALQIVQMIQTTLEGRHYLCEEPDILRRNHFDGHGDYIAHLNSKINYNSTQNYLPGNPDNSLFTDLNNFYNTSQQKNISVFYTHSPVIEDIYFNQSSEFMDLQTRFDDYLIIPILGNISDFVFPRSNFYNTGNHLNASGRDLRTKIIINKMKENENFSRLISGNYLNS
jgi:hypothetical protein